VFGWRSIPKRIASRNAGATTYLVPSFEHAGDLRASACRATTSGWRVLATALALRN